jgi:hypothetical protein
LIRPGFLLPAGREELGSYGDGAGQGAGREEPTVAEQRIRAADSGDDAVRTAPLPDLTGVDLRTLRSLDDPALAAAVDLVLRGSAGLRDVWYVDSEGEMSPGEPGERPFSAGLAEAARGEDSRG